jgi:hypothetical protein
MRISAIEIQGPAGAVRVEATDDGAKVTTERFTRRAGREDAVVARVARSDEYHAWLGAAVQAAAVLYGTTNGEPDASDSQVNDLMNEIRRAAGC